MTVSSDNSSSITVLWGSVDCIHQNGDITGYSVRYKVKGSSGDPQTQSVSGGSVSQTTIMNLMAATTYSIEVAAVTGGSRVGEYSSPVDGVTRGEGRNLIVIQCKMLPRQSYQYIL